ncbi:hypothetical protein NMY22_g5247 [Coprinellus aureogranulatus]|nr:hypothetical protein NMY22_g5247 [Coprinellus aureogranulatus]
MARDGPVEAPSATLTEKAKAKLRAPPPKEFRWLKLLGGKGSAKPAKPAPAVAAKPIQPVQPVLGSQAYGYDQKHAWLPLLESSHPATAVLTGSERIPKYCMDARLLALDLDELQLPPVSVPLYIGNSRRVSNIGACAFEPYLHPPFIQYSSPSLWPHPIALTHRAPNRISTYFSRADGATPLKIWYAIVGTPDWPTVDVARNAHHRLFSNALYPHTAFQLPSPT